MDGSDLVGFGQLEPLNGGILRLRVNDVFSVRHCIHTKVLEAVRFHPAAKIEYLVTSHKLLYVENSGNRKVY